MSAPAATERRPDRRVTAVMVFIAASTVSTALLGPWALIGLVAVAAAVLLVCSSAARPSVTLLLFVAALPFGDLRIGPARIIQLVALFVIGLVVLRGLLDRRELLGWHPALSAGIAFVTAAIVSLPTSVDVPAAVTMTIALVIGLGVAAATLAVVRDRRDLVMVVSAVLLVGAGVLVHALGTAGPVQAGFGGAAVSGRLTGAFGNPNYLGSFAGFVTVLSIGAVVTARRLAARLTASAVTVVGSIALALSFSRGAWAGVLWGVVVLVLLTPTRPRRFAIVALLLVIAGSAVVVAPAFSSEAEILRDRFLTSTDVDANPFDARPLIYREALDMLEERPLTGVGAASFRTAAGSGGRSIQFVEPVHAHNTLLTVAVETGFIGALTLIALTTAVGASVIRALRKTGRTAGRSETETGLLASIAAALATLLAHGLFDHPTYNPTLHLFVWFLTGLTLAGCRIVAGRAERARP
jgi:putative inorganic carbon (hco3(-)) transporter